MLALVGLLSACRCERKNDQHLRDKIYELERRYSMRNAEQIAPGVFRRRRESIIRPEDLLKQMKGLLGPEEYENFLSGLREYYAPDGPWAKEQAQGLERMDQVAKVLAVPVAAGHLGIESAMQLMIAANLILNIK
jgi:hypothetical protein